MLFDAVFSQLTGRISQNDEDKNFRYKAEMDCQAMSGSYRYNQPSVKKEVYSCLDISLYSGGKLLVFG